MEETELIGVLKDTKVRDVYQSIHDQINLLPPDGKTIHRRSNLSNFFGGLVYLYDKETDQRV